MQQEQKSSKRKLVWQLFLSTLKIGAFTFGGGYAMIPLMQDEFVTKKGWVEEKDILDIFAVAQSVPGVIALNTSVFIGYRVAGVAGALAAAAGVSLPSLIILSVISVFYTQFKENRWIAAALSGIRACVVSLIVSAVLRLGKSAMPDLAAKIIAAACFILALVTDVNAVIYILAAGLAGWLISRRAKPV